MFATTPREVGEVSFSTQSVDYGCPSHAAGRQVCCGEPTVGLVLRLWIPDPSFVCVASTPAAGHELPLTRSSSDVWSDQSQG